MKKTILQSARCMSFFLILTVSFIRMPEEEIIQIPKLPESSCTVSASDGFMTVGKEVEITYFTENVPAGGTAQLKFRGDPNMIYEIRVYYSSGKSQSGALTPIKADISGDFGWSWNVSPNTRKGEVRITVTSENTRVDLKMNVY